MRPQHCRLEPPAERAWSGDHKAGRRHTRVLGSAVCLALALTPLIAQRSNVAAVLARVQRDEPLEPRDVRDLVQASREALGYKSLRLSSAPTGLRGVDILMGSDGRPLFMRAASTGPDWRAFTPGRDQTEPRTESVTITHYTRRAATRCDRTLTDDELVVEYRSDGPGWNATTRLVGPREFGTPIFRALAGEVTLTDAGRRMLLDRRTRALTAPWSPPELQTGTRPPRSIAGPALVPGGGSGSPVATGTLSIDEHTLLPLRWSLTTALPAGSTSQPGEYDVHFVYDPGLTIGAPPGVDVPVCVR